VLLVSYRYDRAIKFRKVITLGERELLQVQSICLFTYGSCKLD